MRNSIFSRGETLKRRKHCSSKPVHAQIPYHGVCVFIRIKCCRLQCFQFNVKTASVSLISRLTLHFSSAESSPTKAKRLKAPLLALSGLSSFSITTGPFHRLILCCLKAKEWLAFGGGMRACTTMKTTRRCQKWETLASTCKNSNGFLCQGRMHNSGWNELDLLGLVLQQRYTSHSK